WDMRVIRTLLVTGSVLLLMAAVVGSWRLLPPRFERGDVHPPYSSLRSDPLGARALHDALERTAGVSASRLLESPTTLETPAVTTLLILGLSAGETAEVPAEWLDSLEEFARAGGRVVV